MNVSLVIPAFNAEETLGRLLESVRAMEPTPMEVIVVDDCSTDNTLDIAARFEDVTCVSTPVNSGPGTARNLGAQKASGELLLFIDSDCVILTKDLVDRHRKAHQQYPGCLLTGAVQSMTTNSIAGRAAAYYEWHEMIPCKEDHATRKAVRAGSAHFSVRKKDFDLIGGFDENIRAGEDTVLHHDAVKNGLEVLIRHDIVVGHFDITSVSLLLKKIFRYGKTRMLIKRRGVYGKCSPLLPDNLLLSALLWPLTGTGLTLQIVIHWLPYSKKVLLYLPFLFLYSMVFSFGPTAFLWTGLFDRRRTTDH